MRRRSPPPLFVVIAAVVALAGLAVAALRDGDAVLYNHSPSLPTGLYVRSEGRIARGAVVTVRAIDVAPAEAHARGFAGARDRFLKRVAAFAGDEICADGLDVRINGRVAARRRTHDSAGASLSGWEGCHTLGAGELFLLGDADDSFDGRYWGTTPHSVIEGVWCPLFRCGRSSYVLGDPPALPAARLSRVPRRAAHAARLAPSGFDPYRGFAQ